jgi:hypothetical protein
MPPFISRSLILTVFALLAVGLFALPQARAQYDFTGNGLPDIVLTQAEADGSLRWVAQDFEDLATKDLGIFGRSGYQTNIGEWTAQGVPSRAYVTRDRKGYFYVSVEGVEESIPLGASYENATVILGRDSNGNGTADATLVLPRGTIWSWRFTFDPFKGERGASFERILFGEKHFIPFLFRPRGKFDSLAILVTRNQGQHGKVVYRSLGSKRLRYIRLKNFVLTNERPLVIKGRQGRDTLAFSRTTDQGQVLTEVTLSGKVTKLVVVPVGSSPIIQDFDGNGNEEIGVFSPQRGIAVDGREIPILVDGAEPAPFSGVKDYGKTDVSATPVPTETVIPTSNLASPNPTVISTEIAPPLPLLTYTPTNTPTATATDTPTNTRTPTAASTATPTSTPTITSTPDVVAPSGFSISFDQAQVNIVNQGAVSFTITGGELGTIFSYSIDDTNYGTQALTGSGTITTNPQQVTGFNVSGLSDGSLFLAVTLRDSSNNTSLPQVSSKQKDATSPYITNVSVTNGSYTVSSYLPITFQISENVSISGTPKISLDVGGTTRDATYHAGSSTSSSLVFRYQVQANDNDPDGIVMAFSSVNLNGGSINDSFGNSLSPGFTTPNTSAVTTYGTAANCNALRTVGFTTNGVYQIDPDGNGGLTPFNAYCDMVTDGGGWTLVLNYLHMNGTSPTELSRNTSTPLQNSTNLGSDESNLAAGIYWGHASNSLMNTLSISELRFYCLGSNPSRFVHFKTTLAGCIAYFKSGSGSCSGIANNYSLLPGHAGLQPAGTEGCNQNEGNSAMTFNTFYKSGGVGIGAQWHYLHCDEWFYNTDTHNQIWIR